MNLLLAGELPYDPNQVTPGVIGFAATAIIAGIVMLLMWDFNRRVRRINDREEARERLLQEIADAESGGGGEAGAPRTDGPVAAAAKGDAEAQGDPDGERQSRAGEPEAPPRA